MISSNAAYSEEKGTSWMQGSKGKWKDYRLNKTVAVYEDNIYFFLASQIICENYYSFYAKCV